MNTDKPTCGECRHCIDRDSRSGLCSPPVPAVLKHYLPRVGLDYTWAATCECFETRSRDRALFGAGEEGREETVPKVEHKFKRHQHPMSARPAKRKERQARAQALSGLPNVKTATEHDSRRRDGNRLVKLKPEVRNLLAVEESRWNETWKR